VITSFLRIPIRTVSVRNPELPIASGSEKQEWFDVNCITDSGEQIDVEMQAVAMPGDTLANKHASLRSRMTYNLCDLHAKQDGKGKEYISLCSSFLLLLCDFTVFDNAPDYIHHFSLRDEHGNPFCDKIGMTVAELTKLKNILLKPVSEMSDDEIWSVFFKCANRKEYSALIRNITSRKEEINMANEILMSISQDEVELAHFRSRRMFQMDVDHGLAVSRREGREEGIGIGVKKGIGIGRKEGIGIGVEKGEKAKSLDVARSMLADDEPLDKIVRYTGLSQSEIENLQ
jgi:predicted transposase/invertase (TIGR01784 family)